MTSTTTHNPVVDTLIETLEEERDALSDLAADLDEQLKLLRSQDLGDLEGSTRSTSESVTALGAIREARARKMRLAGRMLGVGNVPTLTDLADAAQAAPDTRAQGRRLRALRTELREQAQDVQQRSEELEQALRYAASVGREMIAFLRGGGQRPPQAQGYNQQGTSEAPDAHPLLNQIG